MASLTIEFHDPEMAYSECGSAVFYSCDICNRTKRGLSMFTIKDDLESLEPYQPEKKE